MQMDNQQSYRRTSRKKNVDRLNDQLIPKPTEVNVADKMMSALTPKEHPFSSHMSRLAVFPSFFSSDDSESGFGSTSRAFLDSSVPNRVQNVILLSKTKGNPYRHEIIEAPVKTRKTPKGENYSLYYTKLKKGENQVSYTTSMKPFLPKPKSTRNILQSLQKKLWVTSYQVDYTGILPANPVKIVNFNEISDIDGIGPFSTSPVKRSFPERISVERPAHKVGIIHPTESGLKDISPNQNTAVRNQHGSQEITSIHDDGFPNQMGHSQVERRTFCTEEQRSELFPEIPHKQRIWNKSSAQEGRHKENCKVRFDESLTQESMSRRSQEGNAAQITERHLDLYSRPHSHTRMSRESRPAELNTKILVNGRKDEQTVENLHDCSSSQPFLVKNRSSHVEFLSGWSSEQEGMTERIELRHRALSPHSFPSVLQRTGSGNKSGPVAGAGSTVSLLELQNSFSKSDAQRNFNSSVTRTVVNLRDNVTSGKKHNFYGINCNYIHG
ncbi:hypothetical protein OJAV_G00158530 [Oryzias javanicus]|uniref:Uncharacterized protein n=1 Tax=Oryzias javanicus TaxID=123683 RepID=A0A437CJ00_ORYJA|nr:hypothetical protein OJAV_G00158530 [Oryzias javanicus]